MRKAAYIVISMILALAAVGCERENLSYPQKEKDAKDTVSSLPDTLPDKSDKSDGSDKSDESDKIDEADSILLSQFAKRLNGQWKGDLETEYYDYLGVKVTGSGTADMTFRLKREGAFEGTGLEVNYQNGKQVYNMPFTWELAADHKLHVLYSDKRSMASDECRFSGDSLTLVLVDATDGLETARYRLARLPE